MTKTDLRRRRAVGVALSVAFMLTAAPALAHHPGEHVHPAAAAPAATPPAASETPAATQTGDNSAPMAMAWPTAAPEEHGGMMMGDRPKPTTFLGRVIAWLGAWHPAVIHFPIALVLTVAFLELAGAVRKQPLYTAGNKILLGVGALGALAAAPLGWADAGLPSAQDDAVLIAHRWIGTLIPFLVFALWMLHRPVEQAAKRLSSRGYEALLAVAVVVILTQAYLGGEITHGHNHMAF